MKFGFKECGTSISESTLNNFEAKIGLHLPAEYRDFLLKYNGGIPDLNYWCTNATWKSSFEYLNVQQGIDIALIKLYGFAPESEDDLIKIFQSMEGSIPSNSIPIGDGSSPVFLLILSGPNRGQIYLWLTDTLPTQDQTKIDHLGFVAHSFTEFLDQLSFIKSI